MIKNRIILVFTFVMMLLMSHNSFSIAIICDIDGFLVTEVRKKVIWEVGPTNFIGFYNPATIKEDYFKALDILMPHRPGCPLIIRDGYVLPQIINEWLASTQPTHEIKNFALNGLKNLTRNSGRNTKISQAIANYVFTPEAYARTMAVEKKGKSILKKCCRRDGRGNRVNRVFLHTNWNADTFACALRNNEIREVISYFEDRAISGEAHLVKPDPAFLHYALKRFNIGPNEKIIYIDGEINNIRVIQSLNINNLHCIHCKDLNFKQVERELRFHGAY